MLDEEGVKYYQKGVARLHKWKKESIVVAENRRRLRLASIESCFKAEELASQQDFENKRTLLFDKFKEDLEKKISQIEEEMYTYKEKKTAVLNQNPQNKRGNHKRKLSCPRKRTSSRPSDVKGPFIVYMLKDEEIEEDLKIIRRALRNRALSPENVEDRSLSYPDHSHNKNYNSSSTKKNNAPKDNAPSFCRKVCPNESSSTINKVHKSVNLKTYSLKKTNHNDKHTDMVKHLPDSPLRTGKKAECSWSTEREVSSESTIKHQSTLSTSLRRKKQSSGDLPDSSTCPAFVTETTYPENRLVRDPVTCSNLPTPETLCCSYSSEFIYYESQNALQVSGNPQSVSETSHIGTQTDINYSDGATQSYSGLPIGGSVDIYTTHSTEIVYYSRSQPPAIQNIVMAPTAYNEKEWCSVNVSDTSHVVTMRSYNEITRQHPSDLLAFQGNEYIISDEQRQRPSGQVEYYDDSQFTADNNNGNEYYSNQPENIVEIENSNNNTSAIIPTVNHEESAEVVYYCDNILDSDNDSLNSAKGSITIISSTDSENLECQVIDNTNHQLENLQSIEESVSEITLKNSTEKLQQL